MKSMMFAFATLLLVIELTSIATAGNPDTEIAKCKAIENGASRLKCFDKIGAATNAALNNNANGGCAIEDWSFTDKADNIYINGTATCEKGKLTYRLYDGKTHKFIASDFTYIEGFAFQSYTDGVSPKNMEIKYTIDSR
jgi:hypothetical protein